ncbi:hypothetical protein AAW51_0200 [Caldimonas brevitalea]|uniref:Thioester reductase (TE) domain-containing protein n=1 Tax=Caldimonas brevitalea TaxID=413882 RepID=A0A0G3BHR0_9BURK|nr:hypothetical protein AAW51_0200 [Caldimonas brevitalea]
MISGVTGFVGSALAASFLARGMRVAALSRNDPDGMRTVNAVIAAAQGQGLDISGALESHLQVLNVDFTQLDSTLEPSALADVTEVWHVAAEMSYSPHKLGRSFDTNVGNTTRLYELVKQHAPACRRFYYVSTAYVAGMAGGPVREELHARPSMVNTYQVTKWSAEQALHLAYLREGLPVTVFRPTVVVGHRHTGWAHRNGFGFYMFLDAMTAIAKAGHTELAVDLLPQTRVDLVSIDQLVADAGTLTLRQDAGRELEVFHCGGGLRVPMGELVPLWGDVAGLRASIGKPTTALEQQFDRAVAPNQPFARTEWHFERAKLDAATQRSVPVTPLTADELRSMCRWYADAAAVVEQDTVAAAG